VHRRRRQLQVSIEPKPCDHDKRFFVPYRCKCYGKSLYVNYNIKI